MFSKDQVKALREMFGLNKSSFARLLNIDVRTLTRWESGAASPSSTAASVMVGLSTGLWNCTNSVDEAKLIKLIRRATEFGGLAYLLVNLFDGHLARSKK